MAELTNGAKVRLQNGESCTVKKELGRGGQGIVYVAEYKGKEYALKWYLQSMSEDFYNNLCRNVQRGAPAPNFIWPIMVTEKVKGNFGYLMSLRPKGYYDMGMIMLHHPNHPASAFAGNIHAQLEACIQICTAFQKLHIMGLSYQDMNDGNFFINPNTGDVLICDNDNVAPDRTNMGILGKAGYMAPEVVEGKEEPNRYTDYYSLAVCLFILIYMNRPFEGKLYLSYPCDNIPAYAKKLFGMESIFIMDPQNDKNRPVPGIHDNVLRRWGLYPGLLGKAFCHTFSHDAITDHTKRVIDKKWKELFLQIKMWYVKCPHCGKETFADPQKPEKPCMYCKRPLPSYSVLKVGRYSIPLINDTNIYSCILTSNECDHNEVSGKVIINQKGAIGIRNLSSTPWTVILPDKTSRVIAQNEGMPAIPGFTIKFGQEEKGEIIKLQ